MLPLCVIQLESQCCPQNVALFLTPSVALNVALYWDNIGREPLGSRRDIVIVVEEYFLKKGFTEHYISLNIVH